MRLWFDDRWMLLVSIFSPVKFVMFFGVCVLLIISMPLAEHAFFFFFAKFQMSNQGWTRSGGEREFIVVMNM